MTVTSHERDQDTGPWGNLTPLLRGSGSRSHISSHRYFCNPDRLPDCTAPRLLDHSKPLDTGPDCIFNLVEFVCSLQSPNQHLLLSKVCMKLILRVG